MANTVGIGRVGRALLASAAAMALAAGPAVAIAGDQSGKPAETQVAQGAAYALSIPARPLPEAIAALSAATGAQILYTQEEPFGTASVPVTGTFTVDEALARMLAGSGFSARRTGPGAYTLVTTPAAPGAEGLLTLDPVTVTVDRRVETPINTIPGAVTVLEGEGLQEQLEVTRDVEKVLTNLVPGYNDYTFPTIRGRRALVLVNGVPQNETLREGSGFDIENVNPDAIERIEVSRGSTALFGYGAPGGVINIVTKRATTDQPTARTQIGASVNPYALSDSFGPTVYQSVEQKAGRFDYYVGLGYERDKLPFDADGERIPDFTGDTHDYAADLTLGYQLTDDSEIVFRGNYQRREIERSWSLVGGPHATAASRARHDPWADDGYIEDQIYNLTFTDRNLIAGTGLRLEAFLRKHFDSENQIVRGVIADDRLTNNAHGIRSTFNTPLNGLLSKGARIVYGFDYLYDYYDRPAVNAATGQIVTYFAPEVSLETYAAYAQLEVPVGNWMLSGGARREEYRGKTADTSAHPGGVTGGDVKPEGLTLFNVGAVYFIDDHLEAYGSISQGTDITQLGRAARTAQRVEQIRLEADPSTQYELGFRGTYDRWNFSTSVFYTTSHNGVTLIPDPVDPVNSPLAVRREPRKTWGAELAAGYIVNEQVALGGTFAWQEGIVNTGNAGDWRGLDSRNISPTRLVAWVDYKPFEWWDNRLLANYRFGRTPFDKSSTAYGEGSVDPILLVDYFATFDVKPGVLRIGVENILNNDYFDQISQSDQYEFWYTKGPGTTISVSYAITW